MYLRLFKAVNVVGESAKKISVIMLTQAQSLIELLAGRRLKYRFTYLHSLTDLAALSARSPSPGNEPQRSELLFCAYSW